MAEEIGDPEQSLRSVSTVFAAQVVAGEIEIDVSVLRRGRSLTQLTASVRNPGAAPGHSLVAVFGAERPGFEFTDARPPIVPPPHECRRSAIPRRRSSPRCSPSAPT
jgi:acyl-CoA thioesterase